MRLSALLAELGSHEVYGPPDPEILGLADDSRQVKPGWLFACLRGSRDDGHRHIGEALRAGAVALLAEEASPDLPVTTVVVPAARAALARMACSFTGHPSRRLRLYGVTGTNGKTTTAALVDWILNANGRPTGLIGTIQNRVGDKIYPAHQTTPGPIEFQGLLAAMAAAGLQACVAEVSSHALAQARVVRSRFAAAILTNVDRDHLDYHDDTHAYLAAKSLLFQSLPPGEGLAVLNLDDPSYAMIRPVCSGPVLRYGFSEDAEVRGVISWSGPKYQILGVETGNETAAFRLPLPGRANAANALAALALTTAEGIPLTEATRALTAFPGVPGRFEPIDCGQPFTVLVDYAHNPAALRQLLATVRTHTRGRVIVVFGCEGGKDRGKRPLMGEIAAAGADYAIITCDNLHHEEAWPIFAQIRAGFLRGRQGRRPPYRILFSRREAIARALRMATAGDTVIVAGKGHETHLIVDGQALPFDDRVVVREILQTLA